MYSRDDMDSLREQMGDMGAGMDDVDMNDYEKSMNDEKATKETASERCGVAAQLFPCLPGQRLSVCMRGRGLPWRTNDLSSF